MTVYSSDSHQQHSDQGLITCERRPLWTTLLYDGSICLFFNFPPLPVTFLHLLSTTSTNMPMPSFRFLLYLSPLIFYQVLSIKHRVPAVPSYMTWGMSVPSFMSLSSVSFDLCHVPDDKQEENSFGKYRHRKSQNRILSLSLVKTKFCSTNA
uniref:Uncharacterized protein n=1 Tax=Cacopsylla melanoneura TaxID=428564 RepID=A0A8D9BGQ0_9HEMI